MKARFCNDELPRNGEEVLVFGENIVKTAEYVSGLFETDDPELYAHPNPEVKVIGANTFTAVAWVPIEELYEEVMGKKYNT